MRNRVVRICLVATALSLVTAGADAQRKKRGGAAPAAPAAAPAQTQAAPAAGDKPKKGGHQDIELDEGGRAGRSPPGR